MKVSPQSAQSTQSLVDLRLFFSASFLTVFPSKAEIGVTDKCGLADLQPPDWCGGRVTMEIRSELLYR